MPRQRIVAARATTRASRKKTPAAAPKPSKARHREAVATLSFRTPTTAIAPRKPADPDAARRDFQQAAMRWTYVLRNRKRWSSLPASEKNQADRACRFLLHLGLTDADLQTIATDRLVEVVVPYVRENEGWEARIFPWEYVLAGATSTARRGEKLTVVRRLAMQGLPPASRTPVRVLFVQSAPGKLREMYSFDTERELCRSNLRKSNQSNDWLALNTPTPKKLAETVADYRPDIIHLAGFDSHEGLRLLRSPLNRRPDETDGEPGTTDRPEVSDGYLLANESGGHQPLDAVSLGKALCSGGHRPLLVAFNFHNSAARIAPMAVAAGAHAAIGIQDVFDDNLAELFFGSFYRAWRKLDWDLTRGFQTAWQTVRAQPAPVTGSGLVLWSARSLVTAAQAVPPTRVVKPARAAVHWLPAQMPAERAHEIVKPKVEPVTELNYSLLHNKCPLFTTFTLVNGSADYNNKDQLATLADVDITVTLSAGTESASYERRLALETTSLDLKETIHVPLTSELMRSVHESINSSLLVDVTWGKSVYRNSHLVKLLPVDQWRDNDQDGQWLPSFVLPRDSAVTSLVEKAQRYVRVLRDDPSAGFDGYQSLDPRASEPAADVDRQVQALWSTIVHELQLGYINPPPTYSNAMDSQRLRTPSMIVRERCGTCIDLALLVAACCELIDVYPVIFLLKDHAFPGYWREDTFQQQFIEVAEEFVDEMATEHAHTTTAPGAQPVPWWFRETAYQEIVRQVKLGHLVPLESVWLTEHSGFWEAVDGGMENLKKPSRFHSMLDIARAREAGVTPLPLGGRS